MVPWLYRLADDEHNRYEAPHELRVALLAGLRAAVPVVTDPQVGAHERSWCRESHGLILRGARATVGGTVYRMRFVNCKRHICKTHGNNA